MTPDQLARWNAELRDKSPLEITRWAIAQADGRAVVSTNFRPYEAVLLHLCVQAQPDIPVLWVDHGYNRPATYRHAEQLRAAAQAQPQGLPAAHHRRAPRRRLRADPGAGRRGGAQAVQRADEARAVPARHEGAGARRSGSPRLRKVQNPNRAGAGHRVAGPELRHAEGQPGVSTGATPTWRPISRSTICPTNGTTSIRPRPTRNASAGCTPPGAANGSAVRHRRTKPPP